MKKLSIFVCVCLLAACATLLCGCCTQDELKIETQSTLSLAVGTSQKVSYSVNPATAVVRFESDNTDVVKTEGNMLVAVSAGSATITFYAQNKGKTATATCVVTVFDNTPPQDKQPSDSDKDDNKPETQNPQTPEEENPQTPEKDKDQDPQSPEKEPQSPGSDEDQKPQTPENPQTPDKDKDQTPEEKDPQSPGDDNDPIEPETPKFVKFTLINIFSRGAEFDDATKTLTVVRGQKVSFRVDFDKDIVENSPEISTNYTLACEEFDITLFDVDGYSCSFVASSNGTINIMFENTIIGIINVVVK